MKVIFLKVVRLILFEIVCLTYEIYCEIKVAVILTVREIVRAIFS